MTTYADSAFAIGSAHGVCEDYARAAVGPTGPYAIVCDGCSGSPDTDVGARLIALMAERRLRADEPITSTILATTAWLGLVEIEPASPHHWGKPNAFDTTLLIARLSGGQPIVEMWGDGAMAYRTRGGEVRGTRIHAKEGMPPYLSYAWSKARLAGYLELVGARCNRYSGDLDGGFEWTCGEGVEAYVISPAQGAEVVAVFSDGVESFRDSAGVAIPAATMIRELLAFKTLRGCFVTRRFFACERAWKDRGWTHADDLAMAAIYLGDDP